MEYKPDQKSHGGRSHGEFARKRYEHGGERGERKGKERGWMLSKAKEDGVNARGCGSKRGVKERPGRNIRVDKVMEMDPRSNG